jgi:hypothetical protein
MCRQTRSAATNRIVLHDKSPLFDGIIKAGEYPDQCISAAKTVARTVEIPGERV